MTWHSIAWHDTVGRGHGRGSRPSRDPVERRVLSFALIKLEARRHCVPRIGVAAREIGSDLRGWPTEVSPEVRGRPTHAHCMPRCRRDRTRPQAGQARPGQWERTEGGTPPSCKGRRVTGLLDFGWRSVRPISPRCHSGSVPPRATPRCRRWLERHRNKLSPCRSPGASSGCTAAVPASRFRRQPPSSMGHAIIVMGVIRRAVSGCVAVPLAPLVPSSPVLLVVARPLAHDLPGPCGQPACRNWLEAGWMTMATRGRAVFVLFG